MANSLASNPLYIDTAATIWTGDKAVRLIQWIDDNADIADDDDLSITINGVTIAAKAQIATTGGGAPVENVSPNVGNICVWQIGPFSPGVYIHNLIVNTIDHGVLLVWVQ
ncbi:MAG: hypothetical protein SVY53_09280 [Chloroflexota bacterium]|nr:hypothetical protein [Chloroflexota bacterium]